MALLGRVLTGIATAGVGGFLFTKYNSNKDEVSAITKKFYSNKSPNQEKQSPLNFTIKVPDTNGGNNITTKLIGVSAAIGIVVIYFYKDKIVLSKLLQIMKNQESTKQEIQKTIHDEAKDISNKIDDTDEKIQQVQENTEQIQDSANLIGKDIKHMRVDLDDHRYHTNQHLRRIQYQNDQLYQLAASSLKRQHSTPITYPQREIAYYSPQPAITYSATNSPPRSSRSERTSDQHRRSITRRSVAMNQEQIIYDDTYSTPTKGRWLDKFGM